MTTSTQLVAHGPIDVIAAGGIAALGAKVAEDQRTSPVTARVYTHPALEPGVVVIRLEPDAVAQGTDAEMAAFGFGAATATKALGKVRSRTLGFPAWALVHEPKKAKAALDVTEAMRVAKRMVATKPGHAKDAFEKIAKQLQRTAPQFLPSFWEEVGRVVADQASSSMAAQCFERARQAERAYKLEVDPDVSDEAFVEFALLGALSAKTLSAYAKDLTKSAGGVEAYRRFRAIVVKRALGGMPPYSGMGKDLASLAKAAKADEQKEADALAAELIEAPGVGKAPVEFWTTYHDSLLRLGKERPEVRTRLRAIWPEPRGGTDEKKEELANSWMELLAEIGALDDLPDDGLGAWISRMFKFAGKTPRTEAILEAQAARLVALGQPVGCSTRARWGYDLHLDLAEKILQLGVALAPPAEYDDFTTDSMTCDPVLVAGHAVYGKKLVESVANMIGNSEHEHRMRGKAGFLAARRTWIEDRVGELAGKPYDTISSAISMLDGKTTPETFLPFPDLHERLVAVDLADAVALHLRTGIADEWGWPAYEQAAAALGTPVKTGGAFPIMTVWNATKVFAFGASGQIAEHDFVYKPKEHEVDEAWFFDGQFLVDLKVKDRWQAVQYWSGKPKDRFDRKTSYGRYGGHLPDQWSPPGGGVTLGGKLFHAGDQTLSPARDFLCDGTTMWLEDKDDRYVVYDPVKDSKTKADPPAWVADFRREGWEVSAILQPAPAGLTSSPLGLKDGVIGMRRRTKKDDWDDKYPKEHERIDGLAFTTKFRSAFGFVQFPGDDALRAIDPEGADSTRFLGGDGPGVEILSADCDRMCIVNQDAWASRGWGDVLVPPATFWDFLTPRDPTGSAALRAITKPQARVLLDAALRDVAAADKQPRPLPETEAAVRRVLPAVTDPKLIAGIAGVVERGAELSRQTAELAEARAKEHADPSGQGLLGEAAKLRKIAKALAAGKELKIDDCDVDPRDWLHHVRARAALSLSPLCDADDRRKTREMLQAVTGTIFADDLSRMRTFDLEAPDDWDNNIDWSTVFIQKHEASVYVLDPNSDWAIELSTDGTFRIPPVAGTSYMWKLGDTEVKLTKGVGTAWADKFLELPDRGVPWDPEIGIQLAAKSGLSVPEATLLWVNVCGMSTWSKDFLGKKNRDLLGGIKVNEADAAKTTFEELDNDKILDLFEKAVPDDPALLLTPLAPGGMVERLGAAWKAKFGKRAKIPQELIAAAKKDLALGDELGKMLPAFAGGADDAWFLKPDLRPLHELGGWRDDKGLTDNIAGELITLLAWLFVARPVGCAIRGGIPDVIDRLIAVVEHDQLVWPLEDRYIDDDDKKDVALQQSILEAVGGKPVTMPDDDDDKAIGGRDDGTCIVAAYKNRVYAGFRPQGLTRSRKKIEQLAKLMFDDDLGEKDPLVKLKHLECLRSPGFRAFADRVRETPVAEGGYEANPLASVPKLVTKVGNELSISEAAAALYLQTLALSEPTQQRVCSWNAWKPKQYKDAAAELVKKKLVVEGKRERAGRTVFAKGGYSKGEGKNLPMEEWKQAFYTTLDRHLPTEPCHLLFARAWKRIEDGDKP